MEPELASKGERLRAAVIDGFLFAVPYALIKADWGDGAALAGGVLMLALTGVQFWLLSTRAQSVGKAMVKIRIVRVSDGGNGGFFTNVVKRSIFSGLLNLIPLYWLIDSCLIFREDRRCAHDFIAGTRVVKVSIPA